MRILIYLAGAVFIFLTIREIMADYRELSPKLASKLKLKSTHTEYTLARIIFAEAAGEPYKGKVAVGCVIRNRVKDRRWPNTYESVIHQHSQFSGVNSPLWHLFAADYRLTQKEEAVKQQCLEIAKRIISNEQPDITAGANHFYNPKKATPSWSKRMRVTRIIGNHIFLRE